MAALPLANAHRTSREQRAQVQHAAEHATRQLERAVPDEVKRAATAIERERPLTNFVTCLMCSDPSVTCNRYTKASNMHMDHGCNAT